MWWFFGILLLILILSRLETFFNRARKEVNETIGEVVFASRMPSGRVTLEEMQQKDIHPYFCAAEYRMIWVEHPSQKEVCPWCDSTLVPFS